MATWEMCAFSLPITADFVFYSLPQSHLHLCVCVCVSEGPARMERIMSQNYL